MRQVYHKVGFYAKALAAKWVGARQVVLASALHAATMGLSRMRSGHGQIGDLLSLHLLPICSILIVAESAFLCVFDFRFRYG